MTPKAMATTPPISVLIKLTTSFVSQDNPSLSCSVAPRTLSIVVAKNAAKVAMGTDFKSISPMDNPYKGNRRPPTNAAAVPSADTAPSVPGGTRSNVVIRNVVFP